MSMMRDTDLVCTDCRWRGGHSPDCPRKGEPWPTVEVPDDIGSTNRTIAEALFEQLLRIGSFHFGSEGILLFGKDGARVGTIDWRDGNKAAVDALCARAGVREQGGAGPTMSEVTTVPITADNLPDGPKWEQDGACWKAVRCTPRITGVAWRWQPMNAKALAKEEPEGEMTDFPPGGIGIA